MAACSVEIKIADMGRDHLLITVLLLHLLQEILQPFPQGQPFRAGFDVEVGSGAPIHRLGCGGFVGKILPARPARFKAGLAVEDDEIAFMGRKAQRHFHLFALDGEGWQRAARAAHR